MAWAKKGVWNDILSYCSKNYDEESFMMDGSIIRAHACANGYQKNQQEEQALGRSKGGFTTKIQALVDALGNPLSFILTPGQASEVKQSPELIKEITDTNILGDNLIVMNCSIKLSHKIVPRLFHHNQIARFKEM